MTRGFAEVGFTRDDSPRRAERQWTAVSRMNRLAQEEFLRSCERYSEIALVALATLEQMESPLLDYKDASSFTLRHGILLNKHQLESAFVIFPAGDDLVDMKAFLDRIKADDSVPGTIYSSDRVESPHRYKHCHISQPGQGQTRPLRAPSTPCAV